VTEVHVIMPEDIDDPARPSGGNTYDRRVCHGLAALGWTVREYAVPAAADGHATLAHTLRRVPDGAVALLDGLIASPAPEALVPEAGRLRQVVLVHMPFGHRPPHGAARAREQEVLGGATAVVTTSAWTRRRLAELYDLPPERVHVAEPGVDAAPVAPGTTAGGALLCVAAVTPGKGHDVLLDALALTSDLPWTCTCVGSLVRDPAFSDTVRRRAHDAGRVRFPGPLTGAALDRAYAAADVLVLPSHAETYGMVVTEALARGLPVIATDVGGVSEALGHAEDGVRPGLLVPPGDPAALGAALRRWLSDAELRSRLRRAARERRVLLRRWPATTSDVAGVLAAAAGTKPPGGLVPEGAARSGTKASEAFVPARAAR
jgi:glycosyltransferase involved in cell wall biosynthesis